MAVAGAAQLGQQPFDDLGLGHAERGGRLVEHQDRRPAQHGPGDGDQLALAARQRARPAGAGSAIGDVQPLEQAPGLVGHRRTRRGRPRRCRSLPRNRLATAAEVVAQGQVLPHDGHALVAGGDRVAGERLARHLDACRVSAGVGAGDALHERRLAGAVLADQRQDLAAVAARGRRRAAPRTAPKRLCTSRTRSTGHSSRSAGSPTVFLPPCWPSAMGRVCRTRIAAARGDARRPRRAARWQRVAATLPGDGNRPPTDLERDRCAHSRSATSPPQPQPPSSCWRPAAARDPPARRPAPPRRRPRRPPPPTGSSSTTAATSTTTGTPTSTSTPSSTRCHTSQLTAAVGVSQGAAGSIYTAIMLTNHSSTTCVIAGYPGVSLLDAAATRSAPPPRGRPDPPPR